MQFHHFSPLISECQSQLWFIVQVDIVSDCESDYYEDFVPDLDNIENDRNNDCNDEESNSVDMLSFVIDQLKQEGSSLDADLSELHGVKLKLPNVPQTAREADLSELHGVKLPEVPQIAREADMDMDIIRKLLDADQDIDEGKILLF